MKKIYTLAFALLLLTAHIFAQQVSRSKSLNLNQRKCATAELLQQFNALHPDAETTAQFEAWMSQKIAERKADPTLPKITPGVTLPVVFHIIHNNEAVGVGRNVSQAAIIQQVLQINKDYANLSNSPYAVSEDMGIRFGLAQTDPLGNLMPEPGIDRINRSDKGWTAPPYTVGYASGANNYLTNTIKPGSIWDPTKYLNIWVSEWEAGILGIATFPASSGLTGLNNSETNTTAGVTISYTTVGSVFKPFGVCADPYGKGKTLTHELGHFFGLRHIWGDTDCGTDYCNDTPTHFENNSGEPTHPKPNSCGTADEMFENYMDYSDDIIANTFTVNQGDRMEAVFANSPRRGSLATSTVGSVLVTASNAIAFADCDGVLRVNENSGMTTCPRFRDISLELNVEDKATAATTVTITTGGTAVNGVDYQLLTPTVSFATGDNYKAVNLRIFDDALPSGNKTIVLGYTIGSGGGVTAGTTGQTITITKVEDDAVKTINVTNPNVQLLSQNFGTAANNGLVPGWLLANFSGTANTFTANAQFGSATGFSAADGRILHITNGSASDKTNEIAANAYTFTAASDAAAVTPAFNTIGYKNIKISFDYASNGVGNDFGYLRYTTTSQTQGFLPVYNTLGNLVAFQGVTGKTNVVVPLPDILANQPNVWICFEWQNDAATGINPPFTIDNVVITGEAAGVETVLNQSVVQTHPAGQSEQYVSSTNNIIATITNPSVDLGCVTATVSSSGTGLTTLNTTGGVYQRSNKVISLSPAVANSTATYQATFYFTTAELAAWASSVPNLKLMKVQDGVNLATTLTAANSVVVATTVDDQRTTKGYASFTANFTGGFSQFLLVSPLTALPVQSLDFAARPATNNILLTWNTTAEQNNKGFAIERSKDGVTYEKIAWVDGAGNSSSLRNYSYTDNFVQPEVLYYYRLRQTDFDNRSLLSEVRQAKIKGNGSISISISPNPASDKVKIFVAGASGLSDINLFNAEGKLVRTWKKQQLSSAITLNISGLAKGVYIFNIATGNDTRVEKLVIN
ncbi:zinc-dependent metalloprotease [Ferruginibacter sp. HRS2-29]|uniref:zinc-dependent metalloprotease n=1 Tax=Ferruginibacter sp. HRS2-29 TaxID=2487334 RepID=UPI0020CE5997|nr:zinc-dependent metalloprotease [Ferruginibacter sp. HRS2-29]